MMFEQQRKMEGEKLGASSSNSIASTELQPSSGNNKPEPSISDRATTKEAITDACISADQIPSEKETRPPNDPFNPPTKRAKADEQRHDCCDPHES